MPHDPATPAPAAMTIPDAVRYTGMSRSRLYDLAADGVLTFRRAGRRSLILRTDLDAIIAALPAAPIRQRPKTAA